MPGLIWNINSILTENTHLGKSPVTRSQDIFITSTEVMPFSTFHHHHSEDKSKTTISSSPKPCGTGMQQTEKSVGIQAALPLSMLTILSANILKRLIVSSKANVKRETSESKKDGPSSKSKKTEKSPFSKIKRLVKLNKNFTLTFTH